METILPKILNSCCLQLVCFGLMPTDYFAGIVDVVQTLTCLVTSLYRWRFVELLAQNRASIVSMLLWILLIFQAQEICYTFLFDYCTEIGQSGRDSLGCGFVGWFYIFRLIIFLNLLHVVFEAFIYSTVLSFQATQAVDFVKIVLHLVYQMSLFIVVLHFTNILWFLRGLKKWIQPAFNLSSVFAQVF